MSDAWRLITSLLGFCGAMCLFLSASTSDYYVMELGMQEPEYIRTMLVAGFLMVIPAILTSIYYEMKEKDDD